MSTARRDQLFATTRWRLTLLKATVLCSMLLLLEAAAEAGAEVRMGFGVQGLVWEGNQVIGVRGGTPGGATVTELAPLVVGADGKHSIVARSVQASLHDARPARSCEYYSSWSGVPVQDMTAYLRDHCSMIVLPMRLLWIMRGG